MELSGVRVPVEKLITHPHYPPQASSQPTVAEKTRGRMEPGARIELTTS
jgi:hypothetical protein